MASTTRVLGKPERVNLIVQALKPDYLLLDIFLHLRSETWTLVDRSSAGEGGSSAILFRGWPGGVSC